MEGNMPKHPKQELPARPGLLRRSVIKDHGLFGIWWYEIPGDVYRFAWARNTDGVFEVSRCKSGFKSMELAIDDAKKNV